MGMGLAGLGTASGAAQGLQEILAQRLRERQMALQEQAQREETDYRNRALTVQTDATAAQREFNNRIALENLNDRKQAGLERFAVNDVESTAVGSSVSPERADVWSQGGQGGVIRAIPMMGETVEGQPAPPIRFRGYTPSEYDRVETRRENIAAREAAAADAANLRRDLQTDQQRFAAGQAATNRAFQADQARTNREFQASQRTTKPPTGTQRAAVKYFDRMKTAMADLSTVYGEISKQSVAGQAQTQWAPNLLKTSAQRRYNNALDRFTEARLRKDSGAAVPPEEYRKDREVYGIRAGDDAATIRQKLAAMKSTAMALAIEAGDTAMADEYGEGWQGVLDPYVGGGGAPTAGGSGEIEYDIYGKPIKR